MGHRKLHLCGISALELWTSVALERTQRPLPTKRTLVRSSAHTASDARSFDVGRMGASSPLEILVPHDATNAPCSGLIRFRAAKSYPLGSFFKIGSNVLACSPELCFVQLASRLSFIELILFGCEMCGTYAVNATAHGLVKRPPLTTASRLRSYAENATGMKCARPAALAARFVFDNACSPMESKVALELSLPHTHGGGGIPRPVLNKQIDAREYDAKRTRIRRCDLLWENEHVAIEYDSSAHHEGIPEIDRDARRRNELAVNQLTVLTVTKQQAYDRASMDALIIAISKLIGHRHRPRVQDYSARRARLHADLYKNDARFRRPIVPSAELPWSAP